MTLLQILTDDRVISLNMVVMGVLGSGLFSAVIYIYTIRVNQIKALRNDLTEFTAELKHKFRALNNLAKEFDKTRALHGKDLEALKNDHKKLDFNLNEVAKQTTEHKIEIQNLKQKYHSL